jgi:hypothetical protein
MSSPEASSFAQPRASQHNGTRGSDTTAGSETPQSLAGESTTVSEAAPIKHELTGNSHRPIPTKGNPTSVNDFIDKQVEIVEKLNEHTNLLVNVILLAAMIFVAWVL